MSSAGWASSDAGSVARATEGSTDDGGGRELDLLSSSSVGGDEHGEMGSMAAASCLGLQCNFDMRSGRLIGIGEHVTRRWRQERVKKEGKRKGG